MGKGTDTGRYGVTWTSRDKRHKHVEDCGGDMGRSEGIDLCVIDL